MTGLGKCLSRWLLSLLCLVTTDRLLTGASRPFATIERLAMSGCFGFCCRPATAMTQADGIAGELHNVGYFLDRAAKKTVVTTTSPQPRAHNQRQLLYSGAY